MTILISGNSQEVFSGSTNSWRDVEGKDFPSCKYIVVDMIWVSLPRMLHILWFAKTDRSVECFCFVRHSIC